ncbi:uncharacterized protein BXZ73DRAFT_107644 [Epithele typhae]|uniref:uncharacterized protein n=1 Tax=Epithele typhae TaxID=378194 RepID=UPI002007BA62|nr:uncharacterized protein BXZ73DRAFT_107644 [Epithele typhae]KAH9912098.1 hypothetical protein BXZ73DRAFT_107644 [Epithele typhae]
MAWMGRMDAVMVSLNRVIACQNHYLDIDEAVVEKTVRKRNGYLEHGFRCLPLLLYGGICYFFDDRHRHKLFWLRLRSRGGLGLDSRKDLEFGYTNLGSAGAATSGLASSGEEPVPSPEPGVVEEAPVLAKPEAPLGEEAPAPAPAPTPEAVMAATAAAEPAPVVEAVPEPIFEVAPEPEPIVEEIPAPQPEPVVEETPASDPAVVGPAPEPDPGPFAVEAASEFEPESSPALEVIPETERLVEAATEPEPVPTPNERYDDVLERLPHALAGYDRHLADPQKRLLPGTRQDVVAELSRWAAGQEEDVSTRTICVLTGAPGLGKSTIAAEFARRLGRRLGASFFFARGIADTSSTRLFFRTIAYQLAHSQGDLHDVFAKAVRDLIHDMDDLLPKIQERYSFGIRFSWLRREMTIQSSSVRQAPFPLKIFFTSSPGDVVDTTVIANVNLWADRNFLCADVAARFLVEDTTDVNGRAEYILSISEPSGALGPLNDLYLKILEAVYPRDVLHADTQTCEDMQAVLGGLALLHDPLSPNTLKTLLGPTIKNPASVLLRLSAVVDYDPNDLDAPARALHAFFTRFRVDVHAQYDKGPYLVRTRREHARLAAACLRALLALPRGSAPVPPHARYACVHWAAHLTQSDRKGEVFALVANFARDALLTWVEAVAEMKRLDVVDGALAKASAWQEIGKICRLLDAVRKWVGEHRDAVKVRPSAVYECGIPLDSVLRC